MGLFQMCNFGFGSERVSLIKHLPSKISLVFLFSVSWFIYFFLVFLFWWLHFSSISADWFEFKRESSLYAITVAFDIFSQVIMFTGILKQKSLVEQIGGYPGGYPVPCLPEDKKIALLPLFPKIKIFSYLEWYCYISQTEGILTLK